MRMKMKNIVLSICALLVFPLLVGPAVATGPWSYLRQLPDNDSGVRLDLASSLSIDTNKQRYYLVDARGGQLVSFDKNGKFLSAFNAGGELKTPVSLTRTTSGILWVADRYDNKLLYIDPRQQKVQRFDLKYPDGKQILPAKIDLDAENRLFVLDQRRGAILQLDDNLNVMHSYQGTAAFKGFVDFKIKGETLWALDGLSSSVYRFAIGSAALEAVQLSGLKFPVSLEIDSAGQFYVLDRHAGIVVVFGPNGEKRFDFLGKGKRNGQLWFAKELIFDWEEKLCVVDEGNNRVDILTR
ncbi:hypothetical protein [Malonomonas rubra]|uniref:hypothetical protein n=1 Tax=Malonomonas rubra TaxID=57040 RepID=UPI0026ED7219|nr:hypothetical protein [Malonomonas rubra]